MRDRPRYSIIPAGAVFDARLERGDLRVICLLGCHTDKLGWCEPASQSVWAALIGCSRQSFQRAIVRLIDAGWVQSRAIGVSQNGQSYASYAYRVVMDRDDPELVLSGYEVAAPTPDDPAHRRAGLPSQAGQPCPDMHGHKQADQEATKDVVDSARARDGDSSEAEKIAAEIADIAGVDTAKHAKWFVAGPAVHVQRFLDAGYVRAQLIEGTKRVMIGRTQPPNDIRYFFESWQRVRGEMETPAPGALPPQPKQTGASHGRSNQQPGIVDAGLRRVAQLRALADGQREFRPGSYDREGDAGNGTGDADVRQLPPGRRSLP